MNNNFEKKQEKHFNNLKWMFRLHYKSWYISKKYTNKYWTLHLSDSVMYDLRLHLSWVRGEDVFLWNRQQIGNCILKIFKERKILKKLIQNVQKDETIINIYMECDLDLSNYK